MPVLAAYLSVILIWSTTPLAIKWSGQSVGFLFGVTGRMLIGTLACLVLLRILRTPLSWNRQARAAYLAASIGVFGSMYCVYWGAQFITSGMLSVLFGLTPLSTAVLAAWILRERSLSLGKILGSLVAIAGLVVIFFTDIAKGDQAASGIAVIVFATVLHSLSTVLVKRYSTEISGIVLNTGSLMLASLLFLLTWWIQDGQVPQAIPDRTLASILYLGIFGSVIGFTLYYYSLKRLDAVRISLIPLLTPVIALVLGHTIDHEPIGPKLLIGSIMILAGLVIHQWGGQIRKIVKP